LPGTGFKTAQRNLCNFVQQVLDKEYIPYFCSSGYRISLAPFIFNCESREVTSILFFLQALLSYT